MTQGEPEGLDLARMIAGQARGATPSRRPPARPRPESRRSSTDPEPIGDALDQVMADQGWSTTMGLHQLLGRWPALVGPVNAAHAQPESFVDRVLTVRADSSTWAASLRLLAPQLVAKLNEALGEGSVLRILVLGPVAPSWKHGRRSVRDGRGPRDTYG